MNIHEKLLLKTKSSKNGLGTKILSSGIYLPNKAVKSTDLFDEFDSESRYGMPRDWMSQTMGIMERRMCDDSCLPSELAIPAAEQAIANYSGNNIDDIEAVIFCGIERDKPEPATAHQIQKKLGLSARYAFDVGNACFGFFDGLRIASSLIESKAAKMVLVVTGEVPTKLTRIVVDELKNGATQRELSNKIGFLSVGDAGAAMLIGSSNDGGATGFIDFDAQTMSQHNDLCYYEKTTDNELDASMKMARIVSKTLKLQESIFDRSKKTKSWQTPRFLLTHQVGKKAFDEVVKLNVVPAERMIKSYDYFGNVTSATLPLNYHQLIESGQAEPGDLVRGCYSGSGIVAGQLSFKL